jgi:hypothetical protein
VATSAAVQPCPDISVAAGNETNQRKPQALLCENVYLGAFEVSPSLPK